MEPLTRDLLVDLTGTLSQGDAFSHIFLGLGALLDNILLSPALARTASPVLDVVHASAPFPASDRASDHDPVLVRLSLPEGSEP
jgi:predicted extracellular nuclease